LRARSSMRRPGAPKRFDEGCGEFVLNRLIFGDLFRCARIERIRGRLRVGGHTASELNACDRYVAVRLWNVESSDLIWLHRRALIERSIVECTQESEVYNFGAALKA
jgi:hypothetical protein